MRSKGFITLLLLICLISTQSFIFNEKVYATNSDEIIFEESVLAPGVQSSDEDGNIDEAENTENDKDAENNDDEQAEFSSEHDKQELIIDKHDDAESDMFSSDESSENDSESAIYEEPNNGILPTFRKGKNIIHFAPAKKHLGIYPGPDAIEAFSEKLIDYNTSKGAIKFPYNKEIPYGLIADIAKWSYEQNAVG